MCVLLSFRWSLSQRQEMRSQCTICRRRRGWDWDRHELQTSLLHPQRTETACCYRGASTGCPGWGWGWAARNTMVHPQVGERWAIRPTVFTQLSIILSPDPPQNNLMYQPHCLLMSQPLLCRGHELLPLDEFNNYSLIFATFLFCSVCVYEVFICWRIIESENPAL